MDFRRSRSSAAEFHANDLLADPRPAVWHHELTTPALVLGSTQRDDVVDHAACAAAGVEVVRRRSGGGAVLLVPGDVTWVDVVLPVGAPGWADDVHRPMIWLGRHLAAAFGDESLQVHTGPMVVTDWSRTICFDGLGPGEVVLGGRKLVGISQRRTRLGARLQCCWYRRYDPHALVELLAAPHRPPIEELVPVATLTAEPAVDVPARLAALLTA